MINKDKLILAWNVTRIVITIFLSMAVFGLNRKNSELNKRNSELENALELTLNNAESLGRAAVYWKFRTEDCKTNWMETLNILNLTLRELSRNEIGTNKKILIDFNQK